MLPRDRTVLELWSRLKEIEDERRFGGRSYPGGMCPFPFRLTGQGFFPGGDGLWRDESRLSMPDPGVLPHGGAVFVGNDFGTLASYERLRTRGFEKVPTWRHLKARITRANIPTSRTFFTNAIMGLREEGSALDKRSWARMPAFAKFCGEFLQYQLNILRPRLLVTMGPEARAAFQSLAIELCDCRVLHTRHPYGDFGLRQDALDGEIEVLARGWSEC